MDKIRVFLADDHVLVRELLRHHLEREEDMEVVGEAGDGEEAVELVSRLEPDVALLDVAMPKLDGIEATRQIKKLRPGVAVLILSAYDDDAYVFAILEAGGAGYLLKDMRATELVAAIRAVHAGEGVLHPAITRKVINYFSKRRLAQPPKAEHLTEREMEVLKMAARGLTNKEIAEGVGISVRTVQGHLGAIFSKLEVGSRTEAILYALRQGWFTLEDVSD